MEGQPSVVEGSIVKVEPSSSHEKNVGTLMRQATDVAGVCRSIVMATAQTIQGRKYVRVEGWQSVAVAYGCVASARDVEAVPGGIRAIGEVRRMSDGQVIATAEGFVGDDEKTWASRPMYARRAMAQTRAVSRACRSAFAFVVTLIDSSLSTTPAEEMDGLQGTTEPPAPTGVAGLKAKLAGPPPSPPAPHDPATGEVQRVTWDRTLSFAFGRDKGKALAELEPASLRWYADALNRDLVDEGKAQWHDSARKRLAHVMAELKSRGNS